MIFGCSCVGYHPGPQEVIVQPDFARSVLDRLPLAEGVLSVWSYICAEEPLQDLYARRRHHGQQRKISFPTLVDLIRDALLEHGGSGRQSFQRGREQGSLNASDPAAYGKLARLPLPVSEAFLAEGTSRLQELFPEIHVVPLPASLQAFTVYILGGKVIKRGPKRLRPVRGTKGGVLVGKTLVALDLSR